MYSTRNAMYGVLLLMLFELVLTLDWEKPWSKDLGGLISPFTSFNTTTLGFDMCACRFFFHLAVSLLNCCNMG